MMRDRVLRKNYYEVHKELFEGVQKWEELRLFLEFEVLL